MKQGDTVLIWGASGGLGSYATQYALNGGAIPVCVVSSPEKADIVRRMGAELVIDRSAEELPVLEGRADPGPEGVAAVRQADPRAHRRRRHRHRLRAPGPGDVRRLGLRDQARRHHHDLRLDQRLPAPVRQPLLLDEPQAHRRLALRQLPRELGGQPAHQQGPHPPDAVQDLPARRRPGRPRTTSTRTCTRARWACCAWPPRRAWACARRRRSCAAGTSRRSTASATSEPLRRTPPRRERLRVAAPAQW